MILARECYSDNADVAPARYALGPRFESPQWENPQRLRTDHYENVCRKTPAGFGTRRP